jgi:hypothetical protein
MIGKRVLGYTMNRAFSLSQFFVKINFLNLCPIHEIGIVRITNIKVLIFLSGSIFDP